MGVFKLDMEALHLMLSQDLDFPCLAPWRPLHLRHVTRQQVVPDGVLESHDSTE